MSKPSHPAQPLTEAAAVDLSVFDAPFATAQVPDRIEFRWRRHEAPFARRLAEEAQAVGQSTCDHARSLLKNALTASDDLQQAVEALHQDVLELRDRCNQRILRGVVSWKRGLSRYPSKR